MEYCINGKYPAPELNKEELWNMSVENFNEWRKKYDYPRIIAFLIAELPFFNEWCTSQEVRYDMMINHSPSSFLTFEKKLFYYELIDDKQSEFNYLTHRKEKVGQDILNNKRYTVILKKTIVPFFTWVSKKIGKQKTKHLLSGGSGSMLGSYYFANKLELIQLGNYKISPNLNLQFGNFENEFCGRLLDFVDIRNLEVNSRVSNVKETKIWFSLASNLKISGDVHGINSYRTSFTEVLETKVNVLKLINGTFQHWKFEDCQVYLKIKNSTIWNWNVKCDQFRISHDELEIVDSNFAEMKPIFPISYGRCCKFHQNIKLMYAQLGNIAMASKHYYLEKKFETKSLRKYKANYDRYDYVEMNKFEKVFRALKYYTLYFKSLFSHIVFIIFIIMKAKIFLITL